MTEPGRDQDALLTLSDASTEEGPALRDARAAADRAAADERAADAIRERLQAAGIPTIPPDDRVAGHLFTDEMVHDLRSSAILNAPGDDRALGYGGTLYLTSRRLLHIGQVVVTMQLTDIVETSLAGERLLVTLRGGEGFAVDADRPRQFRTLLAAAIRQARA